MKQLGVLFGLAIGHVHEEWDCNFFFRGLVHHIFDSGTYFLRVRARNLVTV